MNFTRNGKIARLPRALHEQLNQRLANNEPGESLLAWLNPLPEVQSLLQSEFAGVPIGKQNLSPWRAGGFAECETPQDTLAGLANFSGSVAELDTAT